VFEDKHLADQAVAAVQKVVGHERHDKESIDERHIGRAVTREVVV